MRLLAYLTQYRFRHIGELIRNNKKEPHACSQNLAGKRVIITGATSGIGLETARLFARKGASLVCINRDPVKTRQLENELKDTCNCSIESYIADLTSLEQVRQCSQWLLNNKKPIDILIHNAGVYNTTRLFTGDNIEMVFQVNHLAAFMMNYLLKERLKEQTHARIIYVNSEGHRFALAGVHLNDLRWRWHRYTGLKSYGAAKTAQLLTMMKFNDFFSGSGVIINAMHPGNVTSNMGNNNGPLYLWFKKKLVLSSAKDPEISARALLYLAASEDVRNISGKFFNLTTVELPAPHARDARQVEPVWEKSLDLCGLQ